MCAWANILLSNVTRKTLLPHTQHRFLGFLCIILFDKIFSLLQLFAISGRFRRLNYFWTGHDFQRFKWFFNRLIWSEVRVTRLCSIQTHIFLSLHLRISASNVVLNLILFWILRLSIFINLKCYLGILCYIIIHSGLKSWQLFIHISLL